MHAVNWHSFFFLLFGALACAFAIAVVVSGNIVRMAFYLIASLAAVAGLFFLAGADFLGGLQLLVYVGGTMVLLVFGVMLTARRPFVPLHTGGGQWVVAAIVGVSHYLVVGAVLFVCGLLCMATKRNALGVLMGIELVLNGATVNLVAFGSPWLRADAARSIGLDGQLMAAFVIVLAAAEAAVALAIVLCYYNNHATVDVDQADELKG